MWIVLAILASAVVGAVAGMVFGLAGAVISLPAAIFLGYAGARMEIERK